MCGEKCLKLESPVLVCHGNCNQRIKRNSFFYISTDALDVYCQRCYGNLPSVVHSNLDRNLLKRDLLKRRVDEEVWESWIACDSCDGWVHKICALAHDHPEETTADAPFHCPLCRFREAEKKVKIPDSPNSCFTDGPADDDDLSDRETSHASYLNCAPHSKDENSPSLASSKVRRSGADVWRASTLPASALSNFIEAMLAARLRETGFTDLMERLTVRVTSNVNEQLCVPAPIVNNFVSASGELIASVLPYRQKSVLLFQRIDGVDVCLFSLYVQEFDSSCPEPNRGKVYVAYLDSVEFFTPWEARTIVFHEVLVAYLKWAQARGFDSAHIWACPPQRGDNFIFWCHPNHQRTPSRERLNNWYLVMLQRCERLGIVGDISNLWNTHFAHQSRKFSAIRRDAQLASHQQNIEQPICPPLFEGDFWVLECLRLHRAVASRANCLDLCGEERGGERIARDILKELLNGPMAHLFAHPVNVQLLNIPTYPDVIKNPMDLGTVRSNLRQGKYPSLYEFLQDVNLTFSNARTFNPPGHFVHEAAVQLLRTLDSALSRLLGCDQVSDEQLRAVHIRDSSPPLVTFEGACVGLSSSTASLQSFDCQDSLNSPTFANRSMSFDSLACGEKCADDEDIYAGRPLLPSTNFAQGSTAYRSNTERTELGPRGTQLLMTDLCKSIARLKDDLFVVTFAKPGASNKRPRSNSGENIDVQPKDDVVVPTPQPVGGKPRSKVPAHLLRVAKKPVVNHYAVPKDKAECVDKSCALLLEPLIADTSDPDPLLDSPFVKSRHTFLEMCQFRHYQFDTLRRAKHSSLMMLYHLHQGPSNTNGLRPHCASCSAPITELRWHCDQCVDVDFCVSCVEKTGHASAHEHPLTPFRVSLK